MKSSQSQDRVPGKHEQIFKTCLEAVIPAIDEESLERCLRRRQDGFPAMLLQLIEDCGTRNFGSRNGLNKVIDQVTRKIIADQSFANWIGKTFKAAWIVLFVAENQSIGFQDISKILEFIAKKPGCENLREFLSSIGNTFEIQALTIPSYIQGLEKQIANNETWKALKSLFQNSSTPLSASIPIRTKIPVPTQNYNPFFKKNQPYQQPSSNLGEDEQNQINENYEQMKNDLIRMEDSVLDKFIQENLIQAYESQFLKKKDAYLLQNYQKFITNIENLAKAFDVYSTSLGQQLEEPPEKDKYYNKILNIRSKIHPVFVPQLMNLLNKGKRARGAIKGKDTIVLLGPSGAGKSTIIQLLLGYKLKKGKNSDGIQTLLPTEQLREEHKQFIAKASSKSVTKYVTAISMDLEKYNYYQPIYIVDTPGFFDSGGVVVDACNSLSTIEILGTANSIRFGFIFNFKSWGKKPQAFKQFVKLISRLFKSYQSNKFKVVYFLNEFTKEQIEGFLSRVKQFRKNGLNQYDKGDTKLKEVVDHILSLLSRAQRMAKEFNNDLAKAINSSFCEQLVLMDPTQINISNVYGKFLAQQRKIINPKKEFNNMVSEEAKKTLCQEVVNLEYILNRCMQSKNIGALQYYYKNLNEIAEITKDVDDCAQARQKSEKLLQKIKNQYEQKLKNFKTRMNKILSLNVDESTFDQLRLQKNQLEQYGRNYKTLPKLQNLQKNQEINQFVEEINNKLLRSIEKTQIITQSLYQTICHFSKNFSSKLIENYTKERTKKQKKLITEINELIETSQFARFDESYAKLTQISKFKGDMEQDLDLTIFKKKGSEKIKELVKNYSDKIRNQMTCQTILQESDIQRINQTFSAFQTNSVQLPSIKQEFINIKMETLSLFRQYTQKIKSYMKNKEENTTISEERKVFICKQNARLLCQVKQIERQAKYDLENILSQINSEIKNSKQSIDQLVEEIKKQRPQLLKDIYRQIRRLQKLNLLCELQERTQNNSIINSSQALLINKLQSFENEIQFVLYTLQTYTNNTSSKANEMLNFYKICSSIIKEHLNNKKRKVNLDFLPSQAQENDEVVIICERIIDKIKKKIQSVVKQINSFVFNRMAKIPEIKNFAGIPQGIISRYTRIKKFFDTIKYTEFNPPDLNGQINQAKSDFENIFAQNCQFFESFIVEKINSITNLIRENKMQTVQRSNVSEIVKLKHLIEKLQKLSKQILASHFIKQQDDAEEQGFSTQINTAIFNLFTSIQEEFQKNHQNAAYEKCYYLINSCRTLDSLDSICKLQRKFVDLSKDLNSRTDTDIKAIQATYVDILKLNNVQNLIGFKKAFDYYANFPEQSLQNKKLKEMIEHLKRIISNNQKNLVTKIRGVVRSSKFQNQIGNVQDIEKQLREIWEAVKEINQIIKVKNEKIQLNKQNLEQFSEAVFKIVNNQVQKAKKLIEKGLLDEASDILMAIDNLEEMYREFKLHNESYKKMLEKENCQNKTIAEKLRIQIQQIRQKRDKKYKGETVLIDTNFIEEYQVLKKQQRMQIKNKIIKQNQKKIQEISKKYVKEVENQIEELNRLKKQPYFQNLSGQVREEVEKQISDRINFASKKYEQEKNEARSLQFGKIFTQIKNQTRPHVLKIYESRLNFEFDERLQKLKSSKDVQEIKFIVDEIMIKFNQSQISKHKDISNLYEDFCKNILKVVREYVISKKINTLKKILYYQKNMKGLESEVESLVRQIKEILKFLHYNKRKIKTFNLKKGLDQQFQILNSFAEQLLKKNDLTFQSIAKNQTQSVFYPWRFQSLNLEACVQGLKDMEQINQLENFNQIINSKLQEIHRKQEQIRERVQKIVKELLSAGIYSENNKNISDYQRKELLRKIEEKVNCLRSLQRLGEPGTKFFNKNFTEIIKNTEQNLKKQIEQGIAQNCKDVKSAFEDVQTQFNKQINVSMNLVNYANEILTFIKIEKNLKAILTTTIEQCYRAIEQKISAEVQKILTLKQSQQSLMKQEIQSNLKKKKIIEKECQRQEKQMLEQSRKILEDKLRDEKTQAKIKQIKKAHASQERLKKKEIWQKLEEDFSKIQGQKEKKQMSSKQKLSSSFEKYCDLVTIFYKAVLELSYKQDYYKEKLQKCLSEHKKVLKKKIFYLIYEILKAKKDGYASILIGSLQIFKNNQAVQWQAKVKGNGIQYVLKELQLKDSKKDSLKKLYEKYQNEFRDWTKKYQLNPKQETINQLLQSVKNSSQNSRRFYESEIKQEDFKPYSLIAQILVLWTIQKSDIEDETVQFCYQPHPSQVITIFLCLSLGEQEFPRDLSSKMAQVGTGQGKSLILAGLSCYLALSGFEVSCVCYSEYLSSRDYSAFYKLFESLRVSNKIMYGTFNTVCESLLNKSGQQEKFSQQIKKMLQSQTESLYDSLWNRFKTLFQNISQKSLNKDQSQSKRIMLIDQVDVFFNQEYFGELYRPQVCITSSEIKELIKFVWKKYKQNPEITDANIRQSQEYKNAIRRFKKIENILKEQIKGMILGCRNCNHDYIVRDDMIQYKENDGFSSKLNYGFSTKFAYLKEHDYNRIASIQKAFEISLIIAEFSYARLPKYFRSIIGVTGTYEEMPQHQKYYMRDEYNVKDYYIIPSVYGTIKRRMINKQIITEPENHWKAIIEEIEAVHSTQRPVIVFFQTSGELESFYNSVGFHHLQNKTTFLNETHQSGERDLRIKKTCQKRQITLMTKSFGRGTDFIVFDESIFKLGVNGGLHVIQTFLSSENSQQIQIQGRTARQGDPGTYVLIVKRTDLQRLQMGEEAVRNFNVQVKKFRKQKQQKQYEETIKLLKQSQTKHQQSIRVYLNQNIAEKDIINYIWSLNKYEQIRKKSCKTSIFFDGTVSMSSPISKLHSILEQVMKDISETIAKYPNAKQSQIQLGVYRNYNCKSSMILQTTSFENRPQNLLAFWKEVKVQGGMGNEALEVPYNYINSHEEIDQVIMIGDAAANTEQETIDKRKRFQQGSLIGEQYWSKYLPVLSAEKELQKLKARKLPIHCFYLKADEYFKKVSKETGGVSEKFQIEHAEASKKLSYFIATRILNQVAQNESEAKLMISEYVKAEKKRYSS